MCCQMFQLPHLRGTQSFQGCLQCTIDRRMAAQVRELKPMGSWQWEGHLGKRTEPCAQGLSHSAIDQTIGAQ
ncbi:hypothetical protein EDP1_3469 [Pseudomonas putida S610]|nr:hypothetical protein EDP1_3469 [Pseudomonas putida S610]